MTENTRNSFVRIPPSTRQKLKVLAAQRGMTMQAMVEWLLNQEIERTEKKGEKDDKKL